MKLPSQPKKPALDLKHIKLYSTGRNGKRYTDHFYKGRNHNFGIEISIQNNTSNQKNVKIGGCVFDNMDHIIARWNTTLVVNPHANNAIDFYITHEYFAKMNVGVYHLCFWINDKKCLLNILK